jgi:hypothetical protein
MQLGKALVGAIIGAALGIGLLIAVYLLFQIDHVALAIGVALLTGLGVRTLVSTTGHASYTRGAVTGILALAAYVGGWLLVAELAKAHAAAAPRRPAVAAKVAEKQADEPADATDQAPVVEEPQQFDRQPPGPGVPKSAAPGQNPLDYVWLAIAALVAYELGRGTGAKPVEAAEEPLEDAPAGAHPDA